MAYTRLPARIANLVRDSQTANIYGFVARDGMMPGSGGRGRWRSRSPGRNRQPERPQLSTPTAQAGWIPLSWQPESCNARMIIKSWASITSVIYRGYYFVHTIKTLNSQGMWCLQEFGFVSGLQCQLQRSR